MPRVAYLAAGDFERIHHMEAHLVMQDVVFNDLFLRIGEYRHFVPGVRPVFRERSCVIDIAAKKSEAERRRVGHRRGERDRPVAQ
ncbi:hypothetical protein GCM10017653_07360 [Ancylobacter defluvii]|uniref:Uncharacterized protein n=1 Tax=Ancylobacter defluvii TaxID=1282440 RepID=A0A9W6JT12_9HYPH|nr:hypothetical protein GCM10017653_07360 [Ancylobacter defluvii]